MIRKEEIRRVLEYAQAEGIEFAELFLEDREETNIPCVSRIVQGVKSLRIYGVGLYLIHGLQKVYLYTNQVTQASLMELVKKGAEMLETERRAEQAGIVLTEKYWHNPCPVVYYPSEIENQRKIRVLLEADQAARSTDISVRSLNLNYFDTDQRVLIANTEGLYTTDRRVTSRIRMQVVVGDGEDAYGTWDDYTKAQGFEAFQQNEEYTEFARDMIVRANRIRTADTIRPCTVPVVLAAGGCGTLWHESCGHSLEAIAIVHKGSAFVDKIGEKVASSRVTLVDDGTLSGQYGSAAIDDEGHPRQRNVLIENGVLKSYMCDRYYGKLLGMESTGNGRRQNYTYAPVPRMTNTCLAEGTDEEAEILGSVEDGLYVESIGGGFGGMQFSLEVKEGFWIKHGKIDRQVKNIMLTGNGIDVIKRIDRVGRKLSYEKGGFCGASSGLVPTTTPQPMVRISHMAIG
ncbi:MAG: TldD/PmbA family protein [Lachnospiraceae bacterium]